MPRLQKTEIYYDAGGTPSAYGTPNANNVNAYTRQYQYDEIGNILQMKQTASGNNFTRNFQYFSGVNTLDKVNTGGGTLIQDFTYDDTGNQITAGSKKRICIKR